MEKFNTVLKQYISIQVGHRTVIFIYLLALLTFLIQHYDISAYKHTTHRKPTQRIDSSRNHLKDRKHTQRIDNSRNHLKDISCYKNKTDQTLNEDLLNPNKTIFFIESSCRGGLNSRQACSVESAASANPGWSTVVLFPGPLSADFLNSPCYEKLTSIGVQLARIDVLALSRGTPVKSLLASDKLAVSNHPVVHSSDVLRILTLYKYGGVYSDLDVMVVRSFDSLPQNFVGKLRPDFVANGIMRFSRDDIGRNFTRIAAMLLASSYKPNLYTENGPVLMGKTLKKFCGTTNITNMSADSCHGLAVLEPEVFYPFPFNKWPLYFKFGKLALGNEYTHHIWNSGARLRRKVPQKSMYARLAQKMCPKIYNLFGRQFGSTF